MKANVLVSTPEVPEPILTPLIIPATVFIALSKKEFNSKD